jgi:hypothetical protein
LEPPHQPADLPLRCRCGHVRGVASDVSPSSGFRFVCYCGDCQAFARLLGRTDVLNDAGGTDIFHLPPARVKITAGSDALRCLRFSAKVLRWYVDCCKTPIANSAADPRFPVTGLIHCFMDHAGDGRSRDAVLGAPVCRLYERSATAPLPLDAPPPPKVRMFLSRGSALIGWWWRGLARPNPFFDERSNAPRSVPRDVPSSERAAV